MHLSWIFLVAIICFSLNVWTIPVDDFSIEVTNQFGQQSISYSTQWFERNLSASRLFSAPGSAVIANNVLTITVESPLAWEDYNFNLLYYYNPSNLYDPNDNPNFPAGPFDATFGGTMNALVLDITTTTDSVTGSITIQTITNQVHIRISFPAGGRSSFQLSYADFPNAQFAAINSIYFLLDSAQDFVINSITFEGISDCTPPPHIQSTSPVELTTDFVTDSLDITAEANGCCFESDFSAFPSFPAPAAQNVFWYHVPAPDPPVPSSLPLSATPSFGFTTVSLWS